VTTFVCSISTLSFGPGTTPPGHGASGTVEFQLPLPVAVMSAARLDNPADRIDARTETARKVLFMRCFEQMPERNDLQFKLRLTIATATFLSIEIWRKINFIRFGLFEHSAKTLRSRP
jgi:hypothetical protein